MDTYLPYRTQPEEIMALLNILAPRIKGAALAELRMINKSIDENTINSCVFLQLIKLQSSTYILTEDGRELTQQPDDSKLREILRLILKRISIYDLTLEYLHHSSKFSPSKVEIGGYWHEYFNQLVKDYDDENLSSAVVFYLKILAWAGFGKYVAAGRGRETRIDFDEVELAKYVTTIAASPNGKKPEPVPVVLEPEKKKEDEQTVVSELPIEEDERLTSLRALKKLRIELTWKDLDSDGAKKLIIDKLDELKGENTILNAKVEKYQKLEKREAVLASKVKSLTRACMQNLKKGKWQQR